MGLRRRKREAKRGLPTACMSERELPDCEQRSRSEAGEVRLFGADDGRDLASVAVGHGSAIRRRPTDLTLQGLGCLLQVGLRICRGYRNGLTHALSPDRLTRSRLDRP